MHMKTEKMHRSLNDAIPILVAGSYSAVKGKDYPPHSHTVWELVYYRSGQIRCPVGTESFVGVPGLLLITPPGTVHAEVALTAYSNYFVQVPADASDDWPVAVYDDPSYGLQGIFAGIVAELGASRHKGSEMVAHYSAQLGIVLERAMARGNTAPGERLVASAEVLINERYGTPMRVGEIADELGCSSSGLRAHFASLRQTTPLAYLQAVRLRHAFGLLRNSSLTVAAIAERTGFDSASHLTRHVRRASGLSPGALRATKGQTNREL